MKNKIAHNMKIYEALYNPMTEEGGDVTLSIHRTKVGAKKAIQKSKNEAKKEFRKTCEFYKKRKITNSF